MNLLLDTEVLQDYTTEPVSVATAKAYMKVNFTDDDSLIESLIKNARIWLENYTGKAYGTRYIRITIEMTAGEWYELPGPVQSVQSVNGYYEADCKDYDLAGSQLRVYASGIYDIYLTYGFTIIPEDAKNDILAITAYTYQNRGIDLSNEGANLVDFPMLATQYSRRVPI
jgi:hypothetical protein